MAHGPWVLSSEEDFYVLWTCATCNAAVGFWKPGNPTNSYPTATNTEYPDNIDDYAGCSCLSTEESS